MTVQQHSCVNPEPPKATAAEINSSICSSVVLNVAGGCQLGSHLQCGAQLWVLWLAGGEASEAAEERGPGGGRQTADTNVYTAGEAIIIQPINADGA